MHNMNLIISCLLSAPLASPPSNYYHHHQMYEVTEGAQGSISAGHTFDPAHQEGVESLAVNRDILYSSSRDFCIKKWDLSRKQQLQV